MNVNGWPRSQSAVPQTLSESTSQHADQWLADILQATSVSATTSTTQSTLQSNFNNYQTTSGPPPSQPPPPLPPTQVLQTPQKSIFQAEVSSNYIAPTAVLSSRTTPQVTPQLTIQPTPLHSYTSPSTSTAESTSTTTDFLQPQRRSSADKRKSIEYQILEETDAPPQSPPRITSPIVANGSNGKVEVRNNYYQHLHFKNDLIAVFNNYFFRLTYSVRPCSTQLLLKSQNLPRDKSK